MRPKKNKYKKIINGIIKYLINSCKSFIIREAFIAKQNTIHVREYLKEPKKLFILWNNSSKMFNWKKKQQQKPKEKQKKKTGKNSIHVQVQIKFYRVGKSAIHYKYLIIIKSKHILIWNIFFFSLMLIANVLVRARTVRTFEKNQNFVFIFNN